MKTRLFLALLCASALVSPHAFAQDEGTTNDYKKTWKGVATLKQLKKNEKTRDLLAVYPVFSGSRRVAQVAGLALKKEAIEGFNSFDKETRTDAAKMDVNSQLKYAYEWKPSLVLNRPRLISVSSIWYQFMGGAHGMYATRGYVFGTPSGSARPRQLHLRDFFRNGNAARTRVNTLLMAKLRATKGKDQQADWVLDGTVKSVKAEQMENFVATKDGLTWYFEPYAMGSYASGEFEVAISARELGPNFRAALLR